MPATGTIAARTGTASASSQTADGRAAALRIKHGQFALHIHAPALIAFDGLIGFIEGAQDFIFLLAIETNVFVNWHKYLPHSLYTTTG